MLIELSFFWVSCFFKRKETVIQTFNVWNATNGLYIGIKKKAFPDNQPDHHTHRKYGLDETLGLPRCYFAVWSQLKTANNKKAPDRFTTSELKLYKPTSKLLKCSEQPQKHKLSFQNETPQTVGSKPLMSDVSITHLFQLLFLLTTIEGSSGFPFWNHLGYDSTS